MDKKFKTFDGQVISDLDKYIENLVNSNKSIKVCVGCDSKQLRHQTLYVVAITFYNASFKNGVHVIFSRFRIDKVRDDFSRLWKEAEYLQQIGEYVHKVLLKLNYVEQFNSTYKLVELHADFNNNSKYLSNKVAQAAVPWLKGMGFNVLIKPDSYAADAADLKCKIK